MSKKDKRKIKQHLQHELNKASNGAGNKHKV